MLMYAHRTHDTHLPLRLHSSQPVTVAGPFGIKSKDNDGGPAESDEDNSGNAVDLNDAELLEMMEQFALMSEEEMEEAFSEVIDMLGGEDDPEIVAAIREVMNAVKVMDDSTRTDTSTTQQNAEDTTGNTVLEMVNAPINNEEL